MTVRKNIMHTRRQFGKTILASVPAAIAWGAVNSKFNGVQIGTISYSFRALPVDQILPGLLKAGISEVELMSNHAEALLGAPAVPRGPGAAEAQKALKDWR